MYIYTDTDGNTHRALPTIWRNASPITWEYLESHGWSREELPDPEPVPEVKTYSKYKIQLACQRIGIWEEVKSAISLAGYADSWANIQSIASDNAEFVAALPAIREAFPEFDVDAILAECEE